MDIRELQREVGKWHERNFPEASIVEIALKAAEEVGELAAACGKLYSGIGDGAELRAKERDAIGDITIVLAAYCQKAGIVMGLAIEETWQKVSKRDWIADPIWGGKDREAKPEEAAMEPRILSDAEIEAIEERNDKRTPGEWHQVGNGEWINDESEQNLARVNSTVGFRSDGKSYLNPIETMQVNASFIAACSVDIPNLLESLKAAREALIGAQWIISKLAPHEALAIQVRGYRPTEEDIATGARYSSMIEKALGEEAKTNGKLD